MIIRKQFTFNNMHIVRNCTSDRCKHSIHAHTYTIEIFISSDKLDNGGMIYDFGLMKRIIKQFIKMFDQTVCLWNKDTELVETIKKVYNRYIILPFSPSAEQLSILFFKVIDLIIQNTVCRNGEGSLSLEKIIVHETRTGYAECTQFDMSLLGIDLVDIEVSKDVEQDIGYKNFFSQLLTGELVFPNPYVQLQIED